MRIAAWFFASGLVVLAGETRYWDLSRQSDFLSGQELKRIVVTSRGTLKVGYDASGPFKFPRKEPSAWCGFALPDGSLLVGTGSGRIYQVATSGDSSEVFATGADLVTSFASSQGSIFASTLPGGRIFKREPAGAWKEFVKLDVDKIWQIGAASDGTLYAVGGTPACVYRIKADGTFARIYEAGAEQALSLLVVAPERLLVGTAGPAQLIQLEGRKGFVRYEFGDGEVPAIVVRPDALYAAVNAKTGQPLPQVLKALEPKPPAPKPPDKAPPKAPEKKDKDPGEYISFAGDPISGTWEGEMQMADLREKFTLKLALKDGRVTGASTSGEDKEEVRLEGSYDEATKTLKLRAKIEAADISIEAKLVADDRLEGQFLAVVQNERIVGRFTLRRTLAQDEPPKAKGKEAGQEGEAAAPPAAVPSPSGPGQAQAGPGPSQASYKSAIWRLTDGLTEPIQEFTFLLTNLAWVGDGLVAGTNFQGRVVKIYPDRSFEYILSFKEANTLGLVVKGDLLHAVLLGDPGKTAFVAGTRAEKGVYLSQIFDTKFLSHWGKIQLRSRGKIQVKTRTANVARTEDTFSDWSEALASFPAQVASPKGRFIQFRILFESPDAEVDYVSVAYKNENQRPKFQSFRVDYQPLVQPGDIPVMAQPQGSSPRLGMPHSPIKRISWMAQDPDGDVLEYRLFYRSAAGGRWVPMAGGRAIPFNQLTWNTEAVPDGLYVLKVVASDAKSNLASEALTEEIESEPVLVDNTKPEVRIASATAERLRGTVSDATSSIMRIEAQVDGGPWATVAPKEGVLDSRRHEFDHDPGIKKGRHVVSVRAFDQEMNVGVATVTVSVP